MNKKRSTVLMSAMLAGFILMGCRLVSMGPAGNPSGGNATTVPVATEMPTSSDVGSSVALDGKTLLEERCNACHSASYVSGLRGTADQWAGLVNSMVRYGADLNPDEQKILAEYLASTNQ